VTSLEQLAHKLQAHLAGDRGSRTRIRAGEARHDLSLFSTDADLQQTIDKWLAQTVACWTCGRRLDPD
jgi:hypothetical protein